MTVPVTSGDRRWGSLLASLIIVGAALVFLAFLALNLRNLRFYEGSVHDLALHIGLPSGLALATLACLFLPAAWRGALALSIAAIVPALYAGEFYFTRSSDNQIELYAKAHGFTYDGRSKLEVLTDYKKQGIAAYPSVRGKDLLINGTGGTLVSPIRIADKPFLPLAGMPNSPTVACNETGSWLTYQADQNGFRNEPAAWDGPVDLALIGDSYTHGYCVDEADSLAGQLERTHPNVLNLGISGIGPLTQLAMLKEYLPAMKPKTVVWLFYEGNDISKDLPQESRSDQLMSYLKTDYSQDLIHRSDDITKTLGGYLDSHMEEALARVDDPYQDLIEHAELHNLRELFGIDPMSLGFVHKNTDDMLDLFGQIMDNAKQTVNGWGGKLMLIYIPDQARYYAGSSHDPIRDHMRERVLAAASAAGIESIDLHAVFSQEPDPTSMWYSPWSHFNPKGYQATAAEIEKHLGAMVAHSPELSPQ